MIEEWNGVLVIDEKRIDKNNRGMEMPGGDMTYVKSAVELGSNDFRTNLECWLFIEKLIYIYEDDLLKSKYLNFNLLLKHVTNSWYPIAVSILYSHLKENVVVSETPYSYTQSEETLGYFKRHYDFLAHCGDLVEK